MAGPFTSVRQLARNFYVGAQTERPQFTYGHSLSKTLKPADLPTDFKKWSKLAQNREAGGEERVAEYPSKT